MSARLILITTLALVIAAPLAGQQPELPVPDVKNAKTSFIGQTNTGGVLVRSGPGDTYYPTMRLNQGTELTVVGIHLDWLKIVPPEGSFCYVAKLYVDRYGDGSAGRINRDDVNIRAGSDLNDSILTPAVKLSRGQDVKILGEKDEYFKIAPPANAYVYVNKKFVTPVREIGPVVVRDRRLPSGDSDGPGEQIAGGSTTRPVQPPSTQEAAVARALAKFEELQQREKALAEMPLQDVPVEQILADYQALANGGLLPADKQGIVADRLAKLPGLVQQKQNDLANITARKTAGERIKALGAEGEELKERLADGPVLYAALGELQVSTVQLDGTQMFRLVDPESKRTVCYIRGDQQKVGRIGRLVAVNGAQSTDPRLGDRMRIITVTEVVDVNRNQLYKTVVAEMMPISLRQTEAQVSTENR